MLNKCQLLLLGFPDGSEGKVSACNAGNPGSIPGSGRSPGEGNSNPLQYSCLEKSHGWRSLVGYSPWGRKESDTTERVHFTSLRYYYLLHQPIHDIGSVLEVFFFSSAVSLSFSFYYFLSIFKLSIFLFSLVFLRCN